MIRIPFGVTHFSPSWHPECAISWEKYFAEIRKLDAIFSQVEACSIRSVGRSGSPASRELFVSKFHEEKKDVSITQNERI
jgi:hypothetical protein